MSGGFGDQLHAIAQQTGIRFDRIVRKVTIDITRDLILATPVDTGYARSNWFFGLTRSGGIDSTHSKNGGPSIKRSLDWAAGLKAGGIFYIVNNVPYIMRLEYGSSKQAPTGMARNVVERWQKIVEGAVREGSRSSRVSEYRGQA